MIKAHITLQELRRRIYVKAKAEKGHRFWGLYVHVVKTGTLREAYKLAKENNGAPGIDGVTFEMFEEVGAEEFLQGIRQELLDGSYWPLRNRVREIPKPGTDKVRVLGIPAIRDRVVQGALKLILEPIFEADFQPRSFGYRPKRSAHQAVKRVAEGIASGKTWVIDLDLSAYFDNVRHDILLRKVAARVQDDRILALLKMILKTSGKKGVPQGGVISPLLSNIHLNEVDKMLEKAEAVTRTGRWVNITYARYADDLVVLISGHPSQEKWVSAVQRRLREEFERLGVSINEAKSRVVDLRQRTSFTFLGFEFRRVKSLRGRWRPQ